MENSDWAERQRELLERHSQWVAEEGGMELPVQLDTYFRPEQQERIKWLNLRTEGTVLDVGCSWGYLLACLGGQAGVDINDRLLDIARLLVPGRQFVCGDARALPFADKSFDTVVIAETLEHLWWMEGVGQAILEARRVARKRILVTVPAPDEGAEAESFKHQWFAGPDEQRALKRLLSAEQSHIPGFICYETRL